MVGGTRFVLHYLDEGHFNGFGHAFFSLLQIQKDISGLYAACSVLLTSSKRQFGPGRRSICPFDKLKKTVQTQTRLLLSF